MVDWSKLELFAAKNYNNPACCSRQEFLLDIKKLRTLQKFLGQPITPSRATLNIFVILYNLFGSAAETLILETTPKELWWKVPPFLSKIGRLRRYGIRLLDGSLASLPEDSREEELNTNLKRI